MTDKPATVPSRGGTKSAKTDVQTPAEGVQIPAINRREFLFYIWGASMALLTGGTGGALYWFLRPRFKEGEFGGLFTITGGFPERGADPLSNPNGKFWLSNTDQGMVALYKVCTHLGCLYSWVGRNGRFECPCHGSKFELSGKYIEGPAPRSLDRFAITIKLKSGNVLQSNEAGDPIPVDVADIEEIVVDTGNRIKREGQVRRIMDVTF